MGEFEEIFKKPKAKHIQITLPKEIDKKLIIESKRVGCTKSYFIKTLISHYCFQKVELDE